VAGTPQATSGTQLWRAWAQHADTTPERLAIAHWKGDGISHRWTWGRLLDEAERYARLLRSEGVSPGRVAGTVVRHHPEFYPLYLGILRAGAIPAVLAYPNARIHPDKFREGLRGMSARSGLDWIVTEESLEGTVRPLVTETGSTVRGILTPLNWSGRHSDFPVEEHGEPDTAFLLQHSSGTTGLQKPVLLNHRCVIGHGRDYARAIGLNDDDVVVSWLPLYHDMGLIAAFHVPLLHAVPIVQLDPFEWVGRPELLLRAITAERGSVTWLPNFAYNLLADRVTDEDLRGTSLASLRLVVNCSEPIRQQSHRRFIDKFSRHGLRPQALASCYAMAETTFAVTQSPPNAEPTVLHVDRDELARGNVRLAAVGELRARPCVSSGLPLTRCQLRVIADDGALLPENRVGELVVRSPFLFEGYRNYPEKTAEVLREGWYHTGDYGFISGGECFVVGRKKDIIIVAGQNICPEDVEDATSGVRGVIPGRVVAFGLESPALGTESIAVVAETEITDPEGRSALRDAVLETAATYGFTIGDVFLVPPRWMLKSSSGKLSRSANRQHILDELVLVDRRYRQAEDVETAVRTSLGVSWRLCVVAITRDDRVITVLLLEPKRRTSDREMMSALDKLEEARPPFGFSEVIIVQPGALPGARSGAIDREACRRAYLSGSLRQRRAIGAAGLPLGATLRLNPSNEYYCRQLRFGWRAIPVPTLFVAGHQHIVSPKHLSLMTDTFCRPMDPLRWARDNSRRPSEFRRLARLVRRWLRWNGLVDEVPTDPYVHHFRPFVVFRNPLSQELNLVFGGAANAFADAAEGAQRTNVLTRRDFDRNKIVFRGCDHIEFFAAYANGISWDAPNIPALLDLLRTLRAEFSKVTRINVYGHSAGCPIAMLAGHALGAERVVLFSPHFGDWHTQHTRSRRQRRRFRSQVFDTLSRPNGVTVYHAYYSQGRPEDHTTAQWLGRLPGVVLHPLDGGDRHLTETDIWRWVPASELYPTPLMSAPLSNRASSLTVDELLEVIREVIPRRVKTITDLDQRLSGFDSLELIGMLAALRRRSNLDVSVEKLVMPSATLRDLLDLSQ
jgi:acyl-CoA synthetase (AMP-forming)/AMP-acid ligase II